MPSAKPRGRPPHADTLTPAEWRVVEAVRHGMSNRQIAARLGVSLDAVKFHVANTLSKLGFQNRHHVRLWTGVRRDSALQLKRETVMQNQALGAIGQISRHTRDIVAAERWYRDVVGLQHLYTFGKLAFFDCDGVRLFLEEADTAAAESCLYFRVADIQAAYRDLAARGVVFTSAPHLIHRHADGIEEWMAFFEDPEGRPLAIMAQTQPS